MSSEFTEKYPKCSEVFSLTKTVLDNIQSGYLLLYKQKPYKSKKLISIKAEINTAE